MCLSAHSDRCIVDRFAECNCFGHADACVYNESVAERHLSINIYGVYEGGGVCIDCSVSFRINSVINSAELVTFVAYLSEDMHE